MQHIKRRCKHCRREYTYCTYGNGPEYGTEAGCSMDYCAECQQAIDRALGAIPVKFGAKYMPITAGKDLLDLFNRVKKEVKEAEEEALKGMKPNQLPIIRAVEASSIFGGAYDNYDTCIYNNRKFIIEWDDATPDDVHVSILMEYDYIDKKFTENYWLVEDRKSYHHTRSIKVDDFTQVKPMELPTGKLHYLDFNWDLVANERPQKPYVPPHEIITYTRTYSGKAVSNILKHDLKNTKIAINGEEVDILYPFMDYELTYEKYRDEDVETIIGIKLA